MPDSALLRFEGECWSQALQFAGAPLDQPVRRSDPPLRREVHKHSKMPIRQFVAADYAEINAGSSWNTKFGSAPAAFDRRFEVMDLAGIDRQVVFPRSIGLYATTSCRRYSSTTAYGWRLTDQTTRLHGGAMYCAKRLCAMMRKSRLSEKFGHLLKQAFFRHRGALQLAPRHTKEGRSSMLEREIVPNYKVAVTPSVHHPERWVVEVLEQ